MLGFRITKLTLFIGFVLTSMTYALLKFNKLVLFSSADYEIWNDIWMNVTLTLATSLGFWFVTEGVSSLFNRFKTKKIEREFLDEVIGRYNNYVHGHTEVHPPRHRPTPNYIETHTIKQVGEIINAYRLKFAEHHALNVETCFRPDATYRTVKLIVRDIKRTRKEYAPYESQFSKAFNKKYHEAVRMWEFFISLHQKRDEETALSLLSSIREQLIQMENLWRSNNNKKVIKGKGRVITLQIPDPPKRWKLPWRKNRVIRIRLHEDSKE